MGIARRAFRVFMTHKALAGVATRIGSFRDARRDPETPQGRSQHHVQQLKKSPTVASRGLLRPCR